MSTDAKPIPRKKLRLRTKLLLLLAAECLLAFALLPPLHWGLYGLVRGESFFKGYPTSYWSRGILQTYTQDRPRQGLEGWIDSTRRRLGFPPERIRVTETLDQDPDALPVLLELLRDEHGMVRGYACGAIHVRVGQARLAGPVGPDLKAAIPRLTEILASYGPNPRVEAALALGAFGPEAEPALLPLRQALAKADAQLRPWLIDAMLSIEPSDPEARAALVRALGDLDLLTRHAAVNMLRSFDFRRGPRGRMILTAMKKELEPALAEARRLELADPKSVGGLRTVGLEAIGEVEKRLGKE